MGVFSHKWMSSLPPKTILVERRLGERLLQGLLELSLRTHNVALQCSYLLRTTQSSHTGCRIVFVYIYSLLLQAYVCNISFYYCHNPPF